MSSKFIEKAWIFKTVTMEEKLVLVALAELCDRNGAFITSMQELSQMTCGSSQLLDNTLSKLTMNHAIVGLSKRGAAYREGGAIKGRLNIDVSDAPNDGQVNNHNAQSAPYASQQVHQQQVHQQQGFQQQASQQQYAKKLSASHRSQISPLNRNSGGKLINVRELSPNVIEDWAQVIMFKSGFAEQTSVWASFIEKLGYSSQALYSMDEITSRLHSHLHSEKSNHQASRSNPQYRKTVRRSAVDELEEKISNFNFNDD